MLELLVNRLGDTLVWEIPWRLRVRIILGEKYGCGPEKLLETLEGKILDMYPDLRPIFCRPALVRVFEG